MMPYPGRPIPHTRGQVGDVFLRELLENGLVSSEYRPTRKGMRLIRS